MIVYPNPAQKTVYISSYVEKGMVLECSIYDVAGKLVRKLYKGIYDQDFLKLVWNGKDINGNDVKSGVYFVRLITPTSQDCAKIVITE